MDTEAIEKLMDLMGRYEVDELSCDGVTLKKSRHRAPTLVPLRADGEFPDLRKHLEPDTNEPWNDIPPDEVSRWALNGGR